MKKIVRIKDDYGVKEDIEISREFSIRKGDEVYIKYNTLEVMSVMHNLEEEIVYYVCFVK